MIVVIFKKQLADMIAKECTHLTPTGTTYYLQLVTCNELPIADHHLPRSGMHLWHYLNLLSLDVTAGAVVGCSFFVHLFSVAINLHALIALGLTVWIIYTTDHLMDAYKIAALRSQNLASTERHRYHQQHFTTLLVMVIVASFILGLEAYFVPKPVLVFGLALGVLVIGYLLFLQKLKFAKEAVGAALYTAGVVAVPCSTLTRSLSTAEVTFIILYALTALVNLLLFSWFDKTTDELDNQQSFTTILGEKATRVLLIILFSIIGMLCCGLIGWQPRNVASSIIIFTMNGVLFLIFCSAKFFSINDRYRRAGDSVFLIPWIYVLLFS